MKITKNDTNYSSRWLLKLFHECIRQLRKEGEPISKHKIKYYAIAITSARIPERISGRAPYNGFFQRLVIGSNAETRNIAWIFTHEFLHSLGYRHTQFPKYLKCGGKHWSEKNPMFEWADKFNSDR
jgi:hypothetical protein